MARYTQVHLASGGRRDHNTWTQTKSYPLVISNLPHLTSHDKIRPSTMLVITIRAHGCKIPDPNKQAFELPPLRFKLLHLLSRQDNVAEAPHENLGLRSGLPGLRIF